MPVDLFEKHGIDPRKPIDLLENQSEVPRETPGFFDQAKNIGKNALVGFGDTYRRNLTDFANLVPGVNIPYQAYGGEGLSYQLGEGAGEIASFLSGSGLGNLAVKGAKALPMLGRGIEATEKALGPGMKRILGTSAYGATTNPEDRTAGAVEGAALGAGAEFLPWAASKMTAIQPRKQAEKIINLLGGGQGVEENAKSLANDIKKSFEMKKGEGSVLYNNIFDSVSGRTLYSDLEKSLSSYKNLEPDIVKSYDRDLNKLHTKFESNPTLKNAHDLQSQLGSSIRKLESSDLKGNLSVADRNVMQAYKEAQNSVRSDINSFLEKSDPNLAGKYEEATQNWVENVVPYLENPRISAIAKGAKTNPKALSNIFKNPEADILKITEDLGPAAKNKILFSELGKMAQNLNPDKLSGEILKLDQKGLSSYLTPEMESEFDTLSSRIGKRDIAQKGAGFLLGGSIAHQLMPGFPLAELGAGLGSAIMYPGAARAIQNKIPIHKITTPISKVVKKGYRPATKAAKAIFLPDKKERNLRERLNLPGE